MNELTWYKFPDNIPKSNGYYDIVIEKRVYLFCSSYITYERKVIAWEAGKPYWEEERQIKKWKRLHIIAFRLQPNPFSADLYK